MERKRDREREVGEERRNKQKERKSAGKRDSRNESVEEKRE